MGRSTPVIGCQRIVLVVAVALAACGGEGRQLREGAQAEVESAVVSRGEQETTASGSVDSGPLARGEAGVQAPGGPGPGRMGDTVALGVVRIWGADPLPQLVLAPPPPGGARVALQGALRDELGALVGLEVRVRGRAIEHQPAPPGRAILVSTYEIVSVGGRKPDVGVLRAEGDALTLGGRKLVDVPDGLRAAVGGKVWVLGTARDGALAVEAYGIIRRP